MYRHSDWQKPKIDNITLFFIANIHIFPPFFTFIDADVVLASHHNNLNSQSKNNFLYYLNTTLRHVLI